MWVDIDYAFAHAASIFTAEISRGRIRPGYVDRLHARWFSRATAGKKAGFEDTPLFEDSDVLSLEE